MRFNDVIVLAAAFAGDAAEFDRALARAIAAGRRPIVVLGADGDSLLLQCRQLERCEMTFDSDFALTSAEQGWLTSIRAGLELTPGGTLVVEWSRLADSITAFEELDRLAAERWREDWIALPGISRFDSTRELGPWAITLAGAKKLKRAASPERRFAARNAAA